MTDLWHMYHERHMHMSAVLVREEGEWEGMRYVDAAYSSEEAIEIVKRAGYKPVRGEKVGHIDGVRLWEREQYDVAGPGAYVVTVESFDDERDDWRPMYKPVEAVYVDGGFHWYRRLMSFASDETDAIQMVTVLLKRKIIEVQSWKPSFKSGLVNTAAAPCILVEIKDDVE